MKDYTSAFLGLILAGVLMMIIGLGLMMTRAYFLQAPPAAFAERREIDQPPASAARASGESTKTPSTRRQQERRPKG